MKNTWKNSNNAMNWWTVQLGNHTSSLKLQNTVKTRYSHSFSEATPVTTQSLSPSSWGVTSQSQHSLERERTEFWDHRVSYSLNTFPALGLFRNIDIARNKDHPAPLGSSKLPNIRFTCPKNNLDFTKEDQKLWPRTKNMHRSPLGNFFQVKAQGRSRW